MSPASARTYTRLSILQYSGESGARLSVTSGAVVRGALREASFEYRVFHACGCMGMILGVILRIFEEMVDEVWNRIDSESGVYILLLVFLVR